MSRRTVATRAQYEAASSDAERVALLEYALRDLTKELSTSAERQPHEYTSADYGPSVQRRPPKCVQCGLRRGSPLHHPALRLFDPAEPRIQQIRRSA
jgi:metal-dependent amidase/aminoacylase/carboxypeptidase family protein